MANNEEEINTTTTNGRVEDVDKSKNDDSPNDRNKSVVDVHFIFLIHGWMGNELEMGYIETSIQRQLATSSSATEIVVFKPKCNVGKTFDGIVNGSTRLENEIVSFIQDYYNQHNFKKEELLKASLNFIGNSLGGLYVRHLIASLPLQIGRFIKLLPNIFVTTVTPHLGCASHTYFNLPRWLERTVGITTRQTGRELFDLDKQRIIYTMSTSSKYLRPLQQYNKRLTYINAFQTDFQVPTATAAFLSSSSTYPHQLIQPNDEIDDDYDGEDGVHSYKNDENPVVAILQTKPDPEILKNGYISSNYDDVAKDDITAMSVMLDSLGWTKVFLDLRPHVPTFHNKTEKKKIVESKLQQSQQRRQIQETMETSQSTLCSIESSRSCHHDHDSKKLPTKKKKAIKKMRKKKKCTREIWEDFVEERKSSTRSSSSPNEVVFSSHELKSYLSNSQNIHIPTGHMVIIANTKDYFHEKTYAKGRPIVDYIVSQLMKDISYDYSHEHNHHQQQ